MKALPLTSPKLLQDSKLCLFSLAVGVTVLHLLLSWRTDSSSDRLTVNSVYWWAVYALLWRRRNSLNLESGAISSFLGLFLLAFVLIKSVSLFWFESVFLRIFPLLAALSLGLLASGFKGLKQYWREGTIVLLLCLPDGIPFLPIEELFKITTLTAKFATFVLWYAGFTVSNQGNYLILPQGATLVLTSCTGTATAFVLLKLAVLFIILFPIRRSNRIFLLIASILIAFVTSSLRVAIMSALVADRAAFNYWHNSPGSEIFSSVAIFFFALLCKFLLRLEQTKTCNSGVRSR